MEAIIKKINQYAMSCVKYVYKRLNSEAKRRCFFISVKLKALFPIYEKNK